MAFMAPVLGWLGGAGSFIMGNAGLITSIAGMASGVMNAQAQRAQGEAEYAAALSEKRQAYAQANLERAVSQRQAARQKREGERVLSRQRTLAATSGFSADDPTSLKLGTETAGAATLEELLTLAQGEDTAKQMEYAGDLTAYGGKSARSAARIGATASQLSSIASWRDMYGGGSGRPSVTSPTARPSKNPNKRLLAAAG